MTSEGFKYPFAVSQTANPVVVDLMHPGLAVANVVASWKVVDVVALSQHSSNPPLPGSVAVLSFPDL